MTREPCGCAHDGRAWKEWCAAHLVEFTERHRRAQKEKDRADLLGWYSMGPDVPEVVTSSELEN